MGFSHATGVDVCLVTPKRARNGALITCDRRINMQLNTKFFSDSEFWCLFVSC